MNSPRSIVVIDVGSTNTKLFHIRPDLTIIDSKSQAVELAHAPPYLNIDAEAVLEFAFAEIPTFDSNVPVDAIVTSCHGSSLALLDENGALAFPIMSYLADVPDDVARAYAAIKPPFEEVFAPEHPLALTLGRQLLWQQSRWPDAFARVRTIVPYAQYIGFRLTGIAASEVSSLGAQTHLWAPNERRYASVVRKKGWDRFMAPIRKAQDVLGPAKGLSLAGHGLVHCGTHDSNANFLRYSGLVPLCLVSTGTWIVAFDSETSVTALDGARDQVSNTTVEGKPVACARFMGGEEYAAICDGAESTLPSLEAVARLIQTGVIALPSFTDSGGPAPWTGGRGRIVGDASLLHVDKSSLASLYTAQMTALMLTNLASAERVMIDGVFSENEVFMAVLADLLPDKSVCRSLERQGTATGAASLALPDPKEAPLPMFEHIAPPKISGLDSYHAHWLEQISTMQD